MKKGALVILCLIVVSLFFTSCIAEYYGYPDTVTLSNEGEIKTISGSCPCVYLSIEDNGENYYDKKVKDLLVVSNDWLEIKCKNGDNRVELRALPNNTDAKRNVEITLGVMKEGKGLKFTDLYVVQY